MCCPSSPLPAKKVNPCFTGRWFVSLLGLPPCLYQIGTKRGTQMEKGGFCMGKHSGNLPDRNITYDDSAKAQMKRPNQWFIGSPETELFPNKKQTVQPANSRPSSGVSLPNVPLWDNTSNFQSVPAQTKSLFGTETALPGTSKELPGNGASLGTSMSSAGECPDSGFCYNGIRRVKVNQVTEFENALHPANGHVFYSGNSKGTNQAYNRVADGNFLPNKEAAGDVGGESFMLMGHNYAREDAHVSPMGSSYIDKGDDNVILMGHKYNKGGETNLSFDGFHDGSDGLPTSSLSSYDLFYDTSPAQTLQLGSGQELNAISPDVKAASTPKTKPPAASKGKVETKASRKEAPNSFPSNVRSLMSTGILDGVPVKYHSVSREELCGIIKGSGYLCGCQSCNFSKALNAFEFERHANCKTKHPNNHIFFESGKTIYQIVQELKSTPESLLFDTIQTVTGSPINQKSFRSWKESFQAATRELQRIYGKEELNL